MVYIHTPTHMCVCTLCPKISDTPGKTISDTPGKTKWQKIAALHYHVTTVNQPHLTHHPTNVRAI